MWCDVSGERYFYFVDYTGSNSYIDCNNNNDADNNNNRDSLRGIVAIRYSR